MILSFHPVLTLNTRHQAKMFQVVCHHRQSIMEGSGTNKYIKLPHLAIKVFSDLLQSTAYLAIFFKNIAYIVYGNVTPKNLGFSYMTFIITAVDSTVCKFRKRYFRRTNLSCEQLFYMLPHSMSVVKILNPCACVKNVFLHQSSRLISRINSFLRPSLIASSIRAASSGSSAQQPASDRSSRFRSSSVNSVFSAFPLYTTELLSMAISSILTVSLRFFSISQYLILIGDCGVNALPFITVSFRKPLQIYDKSAKQTNKTINNL